MCVLFPILVLTSIQKVYVYFPILFLILPVLLPILVLVLMKVVHVYFQYLLLNTSSTTPNTSPSIREKSTRVLTNTTFFNTSSTTFCKGFQPYHIISETGEVSCVWFLKAHIQNPLSLGILEINICNQ